MHSTIKRKINAFFRPIIRSLQYVPQTKEQLIALLNKSQKNRLLDIDALQMIKGVLAVSNKQARDIMIPRPNMIVVANDTSPQAAIPSVIKARHSRFPVVGESRDKVLGILLAKDLLPFALKKKTGFKTVQELVRPATFIPESKRLDVLLKEFRLNRNHMAIVVDEYGGVAGLITIEDVLEQIVGDIIDEYDIAEKEPNIRRIERDTFYVKALTPITEFNRYFETSYSNDEYDTIGGILLQQFGHMPKRSEVIQIDTYQFTVIKASHRGIRLLRVEKLLNEAKNTTDGPS